MNSDHHRNLALAIRVVSEARTLLDYSDAGNQGVEAVIGREWKITADRELEEFIIRNLQDKSDYSILSEESGMIEGDGDLTWIVDPLDGSANFSRNLPFFAISVGLWHGAEPLLGAVLEVPAGRLYSGVVGAGAWCNGDPIRSLLGKPQLPQDGIVCTGYPAGLSHSSRQLQELIEGSQKFGKTRMLGSAAVMLCYVASGRCDSYFERRIALWDVAAALAIVRAAGGVIRIFDITADYRLDVEAASCKHLLMSELSEK
jgi:myo-inositol-1(or 4)-monophosphatase